MALCGLMSSSNVLTPATNTVICGSSLYGLTPRLGALLAFPMVKTDENCISCPFFLRLLCLDSCVDKYMSRNNSLYKNILFPHEVQHGWLLPYNVEMDWKLNYNITHLGIGLKFLFRVLHTDMRSKRKTSKPHHR